MNMKAEVRQQLLANMIIGRCEQETGILFDSALCSGFRCIRFSTSTLEEILPSMKKKAGVWGTGHLLEYEIYNSGDALIFQLSLSSEGLNRPQEKRAEALLRAANAANTADGSGIIAVRRWERFFGADMQAAQQALGEFFEYELPFFETGLREWQADHTHVIREFPKLAEPELLTEGEEKDITDTRFERNQEARRKCIAHYGTACQICGFDFGKTYGAAFAGMIEVHHIVPMSEIREDYVVDPIRDIIPVCSNCHTALHSKKDGVYTPEELKAMIKNHKAE